MNHTVIVHEEVVIKIGMMGRRDVLMLREMKGRHRLKREVVS